MNNKMTIEIDLEKLTKDVLDKETYAEGYNGYAILENIVKAEIKNRIKDGVVSEVIKNLNWDEFKEGGFSRNWLKRTANELLEESMGELVKEKVDKFIKGNMRYVIERQAQVYVEENLIPKLQKLISKVVVVNQDAIDEEMEAMQKSYEENR